MTIHMNDFQERLARIEAGASNTRHTLFVGMDESYVIPAKPKPVKSANLFENLGYGFGRFFAVFLGAALVVAVVVLRMRLGLAAPMPGDPINDQILTGILGLVTAVFIARRLYSSRDGLIGLVSSGALVASVGWHNLVHLWPHWFETICSPMWVAAILSSTDPYSVVVRGVSLTLL